MTSFERKNICYMPCQHSCIFSLPKTLMLEGSENVAGKIERRSKTRKKQGADHNPIFSSNTCLSITSA